MPRVSGSGTHRRSRAAAGGTGAGRADKLALHLAYAALLAEAGRNTAARNEFETILKLHPEDADSLYTLGLLALQDKDFGVARSYFKRLLDTGKRNNDAYYYLGGTAEQARQYPEALDWYRKVGDGERWFGAQAAIGRTLVERHSGCRSDLLRSAGKRRSR